MRRKIFLEGVKKIVGHERKERMRKRGEQRKRKPYLSRLKDTAPMNRKRQLLRNVEP